MILLGVSVSVMSAMLFVLTYPPVVAASSSPDAAGPIPTSAFAAGGTAFGLLLCLIGLFLRWRAQS